MQIAFPTFGRYESLERSLLAVESAATAWKNRALVAEEVARLARINGAAANSSSSRIGQIPNVSRLEMLPGSDSRIKDLLENGPRQETPDWMKRRLQTGQQALPPMQPTSITAEIDAMIPLQLPTPEEVWDVAKSKVKEDDKFTARAAEKEALDLQRNALERALQTKSIKTLVRYPEDTEEKSGRFRNASLNSFHRSAAIPLTLHDLTKAFSEVLTVGNCYFCECVQNLVQELAAKLWYVPGSRTGLTLALEIHSSL